MFKSCHLKRALLTYQKWTTYFDIYSTENSRYLCCAANKTVKSFLCAVQVAVFNMCLNKYIEMNSPEEGKKLKMKRRLQMRDVSIGAEREREREKTEREQQKMLVLGTIKRKTDTILIFRPWSQWEKTGERERRREQKETQRWQIDKCLLDWPTWPYPSHSLFLLLSVWSFAGISVGSYIVSQRVVSAAMCQVAMPALQLPPVFQGIGACTGCREKASPVADAGQFIASMNIALNYFSKAEIPQVTWSYSSQVFRVCMCVKSPFEMQQQQTGTFQFTLKLKKDAITVEIILQICFCTVQGNAC